MVNTDDFIKRLEIILDYYSINASAFADKIGVQRSSLSHLLSGRNKPSLDFILKILEVYPDIDLYWILNGKGNFPKKESDSKDTTLTSDNSVVNMLRNKEGITNTILTNTASSDESKGSTVNENKEQLPTDFFDDTIEKIVFFYKNGTFKIYIPYQKK